MRLATFDSLGKATAAVVVDNHIAPLQKLGDFPGTIRELIAEGPDALARLSTAIATEWSNVGALPLDCDLLLPPIPNPPNNVICLGLNYASHIAESAPVLDQAMVTSSDPVVFSKARSSLNAPYGDIPYDPAVSTQIDWEVELAIVIGKGGRHIAVDRALDHVFGYTVVNDISARDIQLKHKQFFLGKSLDGACPIGPWIVTADEIRDPHNLRLQTRVNGVVKQNGTTAHQIFNIPTTISTISRYITLQPGDIIATGTPEGIGSARKPPEFLAPGDVVEAEIEGIGVIRNRVVLVG